MAAASTDRPARPRWMMIVLFASLALNLIVAGATAGFMWRHGGRVGDAHAAHLPSTMLSYTTTLPADRQKELAARTEAQRQKVRPLRRQLREARDEVVKALAAEPFDMQAYEAAQSHLLAADQKAREAVHQLYGEIAANMTPEERRGFADWRVKRRPFRNPLDEPERQAGGNPH